MKVEKRTWHKSHSFSESCRFAWRGIREVYKTEGNLRRQSWLFGAAIVAAFGLRLPADHLAIVFLTSAFIISLEFVNTALETIEDIVWPEYREAVKRSKDIAAGAVMVASLGGVIVGWLLLGPPLIGLFM